MAWQVGIDEAGYGPNLGPLVMTAVALRTAAPGDCPWHLLADCVRRADDPADGRLVVADSKLVYSTARGLGALETTVLAALAGLPAAEPLEGLTISGLLDRLSPGPFSDLRGEAWYGGTTALPARAEPGDVRLGCERLRATCATALVDAGFCRSLIVSPPAFNDVVDRHGSKGVVLSRGLVELVRACQDSLPPEPVRYIVDKQGGRNQYAAMLQEAFTPAVVLAEEEGSARSAYRVEGLGRPASVVLVPRADVEHFPVALASMVSKYVREVLMGEFNAFWQTHVPGIKPTAGYPTDASRFFTEIRPALEKLGLTDRQVWRQR